LKTLLKLSTVTKSFGAVRALQGVSFDLLPGEVHALLGENGAGKSTLIKVITGAHRPDDGTIEIDGERVTHLTPASSHQLGIACIYQQPALFRDLTVAENMGLRLEPPTALRRVDWHARRARATELLARIGAAVSVEAEVGSLSMPEQQLVEIACAIGAGARIVIMDEPTASLTQQEQTLLSAVVKDLRAKGVGVIYISHRLEEIFQLADRVTVLRDGQSVGTHSVRDMNEGALIKLMVGREVSAIYPPAESVPGQVVFAVRNLSSADGGVRDVSLEIRAGEILGLAGLVGAGRTELARVLFGLTPADAGEILLARPSVAGAVSLGREAPLQNILIRSPQEAVAHGIAYVPEDRRRHGVILEMPIAQNMTLAILRRIFPGAWLRLGAEKKLALDMIRDLAVKAYGPDAPGGSLSGGNQQKVSVARWLATRPKVLILDEPTQGVDVGAKSEIHKIVRGLAREGLAVLMISSDLPEVLGMSDRIAVMRGGTIVDMLPGTADAHSVMASALGQTGGAK
jgi:rhamnose transport system ATP-binding protein